MSPARKSSRLSAQPRPRKHRLASSERSDAAGRGVAGPETPGTVESQGADPDPMNIRSALAAAGLLGVQPDDADLPTDPAEIAALERADEAWLLTTFIEPRGLSDAVLEDRGTTAVGGCGGGRIPPEV